MTDLSDTKITRDEYAWLDRALASLPSKRRNILLLNRKEGLTYQQIADLYGMRVKRVRWHVAEAILQLRREQEGVRRPWWRDQLGRFF